MSQQVFLSSGKVKGKVCDIPILSVTALEKPQRVFRLMLGNVPLERRCGFVLAALRFNGMISVAVLQNKINLVILVGKVMRLNLKLPAKLLQDIIFS